MPRTVEYTLSELLQRVEAGQIPVSAKIQVTLEEDTAPLSPDETARIERDKTLALFEQWKKEDALQTPEARAENERIYADIEKNGIPRVRI